MTQEQAAALQIEQAARNINNAGNFSNFGGNAAAGPRTVDLKGRSQHQQAIFNLIIGGNLGAATAASGLSTINLELFYAQNSCSKIAPTGLNALLTASNPIDGTICTIDDAVTGTNLAVMTNYPAVVTSAATAKAFVRGYHTVANLNAANWASNPNTIVGWDANGTLNFIIPTTGVTAAYPYVNISCRETSYRALFEYSADHSFNIQKIRFTATPANGGNQFQNPLTWAKATWLGGVEKQVISVQSYVSPFQQLNNIVDIVKTPIKIDRQKGIAYSINAQEIPGAAFNGSGTVLTCFCDLYSQPGL